MEALSAQLAGWVLTSALAAAVGALTAYIRSRNDNGKAMEQGMRALLKTQLIVMHKDFAKTGFCPIDMKEQAETIYRAYHALGGNGTGTRLYKDIMDAPVS